MAMLKVCGTFDESLIAIAICPTIKENVINVDLANQLQVPESSIVKNKSNEDQIMNYHYRSMIIILHLNSSLQL